MPEQAGAQQTELPTLAELLAHFAVPIEAFIDNCFAVVHSVKVEFPQLGLTIGAGDWTGVIAEGTHFRWLFDLDLVPEGIAH